MIPVASFLSAYDVGPDTLCSEPVLAYLRASGRVAGDISPARQHMLFERWGALRALYMCGDELGFRLARPMRLLEEGDAVLLRAPQVQGRMMCGLIGADGYAFALAGDALLGLREFDVLRVAEFG